MAAIAEWPSSELHDLARCALVPDLVVAVAPVSDLLGAARAALSDEGDAVQRYLGGDPAVDGASELAASHASPVAACVPCALPTLVVAGGHDVDVPAEIALSYARAHGHYSSPATPAVATLLIDSADHYSVFDGRSAPFLEVVEQANGLLRGLDEQGRRESGAEL